MDKKNVITIGRDFGAGGRKIGNILAGKLGYSYFDKEILTLAAKKSNLIEETIQEYDEKAMNSILYSIAYNAFASYYPSEDNINMRVQKYENNAIKEIASNGDCVIIGRHSDYILRDNQNAFNIFITAPKDFCVTNIIKRENIDLKEAEKKYKNVNKERNNYYSFYTEKDRRDANNYDLCLNRAYYSDEEAAQILYEHITSINSKLPV